MKSFRRIVLISLILMAQFNFTHPFSPEVTLPSTGTVGPEAYIVIEAKLKKSELGRFIGTYASKVPLLVKKYGGEYIVQGGEHTPLEGEWDDTRIVMHKWPNAETARRFWNSDEYKELKKGREGTGDFRIMLLEGLDRSDLDGA